MDDKDLLIEKYHLKHENNAWYSEAENAHKHLIFKDAFVEKSDVIGLLFRINKLCMAKVKYFRANIAFFRLVDVDCQAVRIQDSIAFYFIIVDRTVHSDFNSQKTLSSFCYDLRLKGSHLSHRRRKSQRRNKPQA